jgi:hypothetical protein
MLTKRGIVFSSRNIYSQGIVERIREHKSYEEIQFVDPHDEDFVEKVTNFNPSVFIIDSTDADSPECCRLCEIIDGIPDVTILRLKAQDKDVQVIKSTQVELVNVQDLINLIGKEKTS